MLSDMGMVNIFSRGQGPHRGRCSWEVKGAGPPISHYGLRGATQHIKSLSRVGFVPLSMTMMMIFDSASSGFSSNNFSAASKLDPWLNSAPYHFSLSAVAP